MATDLAGVLWSANQDLAGACLSHPFVRGLATGSLPLDSFHQYVAQDSFFLEAFARAYASALALAPDREGLVAFYELIGGVLEELKLHGSYAARWGIDLSTVTPSAATLAYTDFLQSSRSLREPGPNLRGDDPVHAPVRLSRSSPASPVRRE